MRRVLYCTLFLISLGLGERFVSPGPGVVEQAPNAVYPVGSQFYIAWEDTNTTRPVSIVLFQTKGEGELVYPFEYIELLKSDLPERLTRRKSTEWTVATTKDLELSNVFLLNLFYDGDSGPAAVSQRFNITDPRKVSATTSRPSPTPQVTTTAASTTLASPTSPPSEVPSEAPPEESVGGGLSTGAKVGVGVAIPVVVVCGIAIGYFLNTYLTKRRQAPDPGSGPMPTEPKYILGSGAGPRHELESQHHLSEMQDTSRVREIPHDFYSDQIHR